MTRRASPQIAAVTVGIDHYLLPMTDALKLVEIMGRARPVERTYDARPRWRLREADGLNRVELSLVHERDIISTPTPPARLLALPAPTQKPLT